MSNNNVWQTLSSIDVNEHTDKKNNFTYLSWSWAWATLQEYYPESTYKFKDNLWMPNGSCEVWVDLTVEGVTREMWLAVTDFKNKPIANPSCDLIANARMRCLVKAIAMFGLGHYIYAGESLPMQVQELANQPVELDNDIVVKFEQCQTVEELQELWKGVEDKKLYSQVKDTAANKVAGMSLNPKRQGRLTASVFASAMGINPYQSRQKLYRQIKGIDEPFTGNEMTEYGNLNEPNAVNAYEVSQGVIVTKGGDNQQFVIHRAHDWLGCTPDGFDNDRLIEFKCPYGNMYQDVPIHYMAQVQGQMAITGMEECDLVAWSPEELKIWRIEVSEEYWQVQFDLLSEFWGYIKSDTEPKRRAKPVMPEVNYELLF